MSDIYERRCVIDISAVFKSLSFWVIYSKELCIQSKTQAHSCVVQYIYLHSANVFFNRSVLHEPYKYTNAYNSTL